MIEIDKKDKKILFYLLQDSRQSYKSIGKKIGASKEFIAYRIKRLVKNGIITNFLIIINFERLGYMLMETHYKFININPKIKAKIIQYLINNEHSMFVSLLDGDCDLQVYFYLGKPIEFERLLDDFRETYCSYLKFKSSRFPIRIDFYDFSFLIDDNQKKIPVIKWVWGQKLLPIDRLDYAILTELSKNSRIPVTDLANNLDSTVSTINSRIKKMEKEALIAQYTLNVDWSKLGYHWYHLQIVLREYTKKNEIIDFMRKNPNLIRWCKYLDFDRSLHFSFLLENMDQLRKLINALSNRFPNSINEYQVFSTYKIYKNNYLIPMQICNNNPLTRH